MGASERLCLRWNDFESDIKHGFSELREEKEFFDVTLACDDNKQIKAHKVILSACSPFFRQIIKSILPHSHPLLYLRGIKFAYLESLISFMYNGEVSVTQEDLNDFLAVAEELQVNGLSHHNKVTPKIDDNPPTIKRPRPSPTSSTSSSTSTSGPQPCLSVKEPQEVEDEDDEIDVKSKLAEELGAYVEVEENYDDCGQMMEPTISVECPSSESPQQQHMTYGGEGQVMDPSTTVASSSSADPQEPQQQQQQQHMTYGGGGGQMGGSSDRDLSLDERIMLYASTRCLKGTYKCLKFGCQYESKKLCSLRRHIEARHVTTSGFRCQLCKKIYKTRHGLHSHVSYKHRPKNNKPPPSSQEVTGSNPLGQHNNQSSSCSYLLISSAHN